MLHIFSIANLAWAQTGLEVSRAGGRSAQKAKGIVGYVKNVPTALDILRTRERTGTAGLGVVDMGLRSPKKCSLLLNSLGFLSKSWFQDFSFLMKI